jgi:hypothetical protein
MITESTMYWITRLDYISGFILTVGIVGTTISVIVSIISYFILITGHEYDKKDAKTLLKISIPAFIVTLLILTGGLLIPNTKQYCAIKAVPMVANNERVQEIPDKMLDLADAWMNNLKPKNVTESTDD